MKALTQRYQTVMERNLWKIQERESRIWASQEEASMNTIFVFHQFLAMGDWRYL